MEYRVLGPLEVRGGDGLVEIGAAKERTLLVLLLLRANRFVARDRLIDELWGDHPPATARHTLEAYVSRLRRALAAAGAAGAIESEPRGYRIRVGAEELDALRFERLLEEGRSELDAGALEAAEERLAAALALWRGPALTDLADAPFATAEAERLEELRLAAIEARLEAGLGLARAAELVGELQLLVSEYPLRERLRAELMLALYRSGRQAEALAVYRDGRRRLVDELGIEPGRELQRLEQAILRHDPTLELPPTIARAAPSTPGAERRKLVTALSLEVTGATGGLDAEVLERMFERCFGRVKAVVEFHGGIVEPFVGGAAMAEFGVPVVHEDDALRACRASLEIQRVLQELGLRGRVGVCSGEVVTGASERAAIGGPVNEAARLQQAAKPGEVLIAEATLELGHGSVEIEPADPLTTATGGSLPAYRLMSVAGVEVLGPAREARFVGRVPELTLLQQFWERVLSERCCELVTIVGEAGIGKSRLVDEALRSLDARAVQSRCLPYGDGITYWPAAAVVRQLGAAPSDPLAAATIRSLLGETDRQPQTEEVAWAFRKLLEQEAPLVVVFDDIHRGEETFLDLVEGLALLSSEAALLVVCMARPELLRRRPEWPVTLRLDPLGDEQVAEMIGNRVPAGVRDRITRAAGGNPLFVVELVAMVEQTNDVHVPATLQGLLAARLDQLEEPERRVLEHAAVEGEIFHRGPLQALTPDEPHLTRRLSTLARQGLIRPGKAQIAGEDAFSFAHLLFRDAAYSAVPKAARSRLHERLAEWLVAHAQHLGEFDEIVGYHLETAAAYLLELGSPDEALAERARNSLAVAGRRAAARKDYPAAAQLLERAAALVPDTQLDLRLELDLVEALFWGRRGREALQRAGSVAERAAARGERIGERCARIREAVISSWRDPEGANERLAGLAEQALPAFEAAGDEYALYLAQQALGTVAHIRGRPDTMVDAFDRAAVHAARAGLSERFADWRAVGLLHGSTPVSALLAWQDALDEEERQIYWQVSMRAWATAMLGHSGEARALLARIRPELAEPSTSNAGVRGWCEVSIELLAGDPAAAVATGEESCRLLEKLGQQSVLAVVTGVLGSAYYDLDRLDEADACADRARAFSSSENPLAEMEWRQVRAKVLARRGRHAEAERLANDAVALAETTEMLNAQADSYKDLGEVLLLAGRPVEAARALEEALARYERKENLAMVRRLQPRLETLRAASLA